MEVDLCRPLKSGYRLRGEFWRLQYEGLHDICFECGRYGHCSTDCPLKERGNDDPKSGTNQQTKVCSSEASSSGDRGVANGRYGEWVSVQRRQLRKSRKMKGNFDFPSKVPGEGFAGGDKSGSSQQISEDLNADKVGVKKKQTGSPNDGHNSHAKLTWSRFAHLEDIEGVEGTDMDVEGNSCENACTRVNAPNGEPKRAEFGSASRKVWTKVVPGLDAINLEASHPSHFEGAKIGTSSVVGKSSDPKRRGETQRKTNDKMFKEVTNKLDVGPVSFKPNWNGPKLGCGVVSRDQIGGKKKIFEAHLQGMESGPTHTDIGHEAVGPRHARPPDPNGNVNTGGSVISLILIRPKLGFDEESRI